MIENIKKEQCTGCNMCADLCPKGAITYHTDMEGFWYPIVDKKKCCLCGSCIQKCPAIKTFISDKDNPRVYSAWIKNDEIRKQSTSGGIFYALAEFIIKQNGVVVGCTYAKDYKSAKHIIIDNLEDIKRVMGSKYFQSDLSKLYKKIKELLEKDKLVLFSGTPCQNASLQCYLGKNYDKLFLVDFICMGINSPKAFKAFVEELEKKNKSKVSFVQLKNKNTGWQSLATYIEFKNGKTYHADKEKDIWIKGFIKDKLYMRPACHSCKYKTLPRVSDITLGDFWGITDVSTNSLFKGVSVILINSEKGKYMLNGISSNIVYKENKLKNVIGGNPSLINVTKAGKNRKTFFEELSKTSFSLAIRKSTAVQSGKADAIFSIFDFIKEFCCFYKEKGSKYMKKIDIPKFIYYNWFSPNIVRRGKVYFVPFRNAVIDLENSARIYIYNRNIEVGINKLNGSKAETYLRMFKNSKWISKGGAGLFYNTVLEINKGGGFESGYFTANGGSVIICAKHIVMGQNVMLGRNVIIYDSDHHQILDANNKQKNPAKDVYIGNNVWLMSNVTVLKGVEIKDGAMVGAQTVVSKNLPGKSLLVGGRNARIIKENIKWSRNTVKIK